VLDAFLRSHQFTEFLPVLEKACGPMAAGGLTPSWAALGHQLLAEVAAAQLHRFNNVASESGRPSSLGPGFTAPPGGWDYLNRTAMSWHYYCWALTGHNNDPYDPAMRGLCDEVMGPMVFNTVAARAEELRGSATMLTEFGICEPSFDLPDSQGNIECNFVLRQADSHFQSWSYWDTAGGGYLWDGEGNPVMEHVKVFARPHPQATAGRPVSFQYDPDSRVMHYQYVPDPSLAAATTVYVPELLYPSGYTVTGSPSLQWATDEANPQLLLVTATDAEPSRIIIRPVE
jgi:endoglycosylceramidase